jgi:hypothetical protein
MQREIIFLLSDLAYGIEAIKFVHLNSGKVQVSRKVDGMRTLVMGRVIVFLIERLFRRGRVRGAAHQLVECVVDVGTLVL